MEKLYLLGNVHYEHDGVIAIDAKPEQSLKFLRFFPKN